MWYRGDGAPAWGDGGLCPLGCTAALDLLPPSCRLAAALSLVGRGYAQRVGSRINLVLALEPSQKTLSRKIVKERKKSHDFHSSWRSTKFRIHSMSF